ncbi:MAG: class C sortase [Clostridiales bacterium]|nr:class C sortase [Clostridiales bacterium]
MKQIRKQRTTGKRNQLMTIILVCVLLIGLAILLYPSVSNRWNERVMTKAVAAYDEAVSDLTDEDYSAYFEAAEAYNEALQEVGSASALSAPDLIDGYEEILDITGTGIMGYITIDKIDVELPVYHGTDASVLQVGAGHLKGSSLPIGGEGTHSVISAHRGLPSSLLFTNLDQLEEGDTFTITVLNRVFTYEVDRISIVLPDEAENLYIEDGEDYCTLMTCTPYGINTHRLLVRGHRVENLNTADIRVTAEANEINTYAAALIAAVPMLVILLIWLIIRTRRKSRRHQRRHVNDNYKE